MLTYYYTVLLVPDDSTEGSGVNNAPEENTVPENAPYLPLTDEDFFGGSSEELLDHDFWRNFVH